MIHLTPYPFTAGKPAFEPDGDPRLPRSTPEREGIPSGYLRDFFRQADGAGELPLLHSAAVLCHGKLVACVSRAPYSAALPHMTFSFSKTVVSMAVGMAAAEGLLSVEDSVVSFFPEKQPPLFRSPRMAAMKIRHLLTMTSGANFSEAGSEMERDWVRYTYIYYAGRKIPLQQHEQLPAGRDPAQGDRTDADGIPYAAPV